MRFLFFWAKNKKIPKRGNIFCKSKCLTQLLSLLCLSFANRSTKQTKATNGKKRTNRNNESPWRKYFTFTPLQLLPQERRDLAKSPCRPPTGLPVSNCCSSPLPSTVALRLVNAAILQFCNSHLPWHRLNCLQFSFQLLGKLFSFLQFCYQFSFFSFSSAWPSHQVHLSLKANQLYRSHKCTKRHQRAPSRVHNKQPNVTEVFLGLFTFNTQHKLRKGRKKLNLFLLILDFTIN